MSLPAVPGPSAEPGGLAGHLDGFVRAVRAAGVPVGISQAVDAAEVLLVVDLLEREQFRAGLAAVLLQRAAHRPPFDVLFDLWWPVGDRPRPEQPAPDGAREAVGSTFDLPGGEGDPTEAMRERLLQLLLDGDEEALRRLAKEAVELFGRGQPTASGQSFFGDRVLRALSPETLGARLMAGLLGDADSGGLAEQVARSTSRERTAAFRAAVDAEVRRRAAAEKGRDQVARNAVRPLADEVEFLRAQAADLAELRRTVAPLARRLAVRLSARRRHGRQGRLDFRRTVRASLGTGGVPVVTHSRPRAVRKPELVVLCDVSGSVAGFSSFTLMLTQALREHFTGVRAFAFVDSTDEVTRFFRPGVDVADAVTRIGREARVVAFDGHSDYGTALEVFADRWPAAVGPRTSLLVLGDGRTNYRPPGLPVLADLVGRSRTAHWLNPEPRRMWGSGDSAADRYGEVIDMVECRTAAQLAEFVTTL